MSAEELLSKLARVRKNGPGRWMARCPAHDDGRASLSILELESDRVLVHCFAGCSTDEVIQAAGLDWSALFADQPNEWPGKKYRGMRVFRARELIEALGHELTVALIICGDVAEGRPVERERLAEARQRILNFMVEMRRA